MSQQDRLFLWSEVPLWSLTGLQGDSSLVLEGGELVQFLDKHRHSFGQTAVLLELKDPSIFQVKLNQLVGKNFSGYVASKLGRQPELNDLKYFEKIPELKKMFLEMDSPEKIKLYFNELIEESRCQQSGNEDFIKDLLPLFLKHFVERAEIISTAIQHPNQFKIKSIYEVFHKLAGSGKTYGFPELGAEANKIMLVLKNKNQDSEIDSESRELCKLFLEIALVEVLDRYSQ